MFNQPHAPIDSPKDAASPPDSLAPFYLRMNSGYGVVHKNLMMFIWFGPTDMSVVPFMHAGAAHVYKDFSDLHALVVVAPGAVPPDRAQRVEFADAWNVIKPKSVATAIELTGFTMTVVKTAMSAISLLSRSRDTFRTFGDVREAALWLGTRCALSPGRIISLAHALPRHA